MLFSSGGEECSGQVACAHSVNGLCLLALCAALCVAARTGWRMSRAPFCFGYHRVAQEGTQACATLRQRLFFVSGVVWPAWRHAERCGIPSHFRAFEDAANLLLLTCCIRQLLVLVAAVMLECMQSTPPPRL